MCGKVSLAASHIHSPASNTLIPDRFGIHGFHLAHILKTMDSKPVWNVLLAGERIWEQAAYVM